MDAEILTIDQVAQFMQLSRDTVYRLAAKGKLPGRKVGRVWRFHRRAIETYVMGVAPLPESPSNNDNESSMQDER